jgi:hypothetical protein
MTLCPTCRSSRSDARAIYLEPRGSGALARSASVNTLVAGLGGRCSWVSALSSARTARTCGHIADRQDHVAGDRLDNRSSDGMAPD